MTDAADADKTDLELMLDDVYQYACETRGATSNRPLSLALLSRRYNKRVAKLAPRGVTLIQLLKKDARFSVTNDNGAYKVLPVYPEDTQRMMEARAALDALFSTPLNEEDLKHLPQFDSSDE